MSIVKVDLSEQFVSDVLIMAFDEHHGGCWHWATAGNPQWICKSDTPSRYNSSVYLWSHCWISLADSKSDPAHEYRIDSGTVAAGIQWILNPANTSECDGIRDDVIRAVFDPGGSTAALDTEVCDRIVQAGLFGRIKY